jgi:hypothetical protein
VPVAAAMPVLAPAIAIIVLGIVLFSICLLISRRVRTRRTQEIAVWGMLGSASLSAFGIVALMFMAYIWS